MRQVIRRFLKHLEAEKNASETTIETYQYDLHKFDAYLVKRLGDKIPTRRCLPRPHSGLSHVAVRGRSSKAKRSIGSCAGLAAIRSFFKYAHRAGLLRDNPAADIPLPKIRMGEVRALSQDECGRLLRVVETNPSPFRKVRDRAMIVTFPLNGREAPGNCTTG